VPAFGVDSWHVDYGLPKLHTSSAAQQPPKPARVGRYHQRSLDQKKRLAAQVDDNKMLVSALRFYIARLLANRRIPAAPIRAIETKQTARERQHLKAIRRLLGISYFKASTLARVKHKPPVVAGDVMIMPGSYRAKLEAIGFDPWSDPDELADFERLNANLELDEKTAAFARRYPILENVRRFLLGETPKAFGGTTPSLLKDQILHAPHSCAQPSLQNKIYADINNKQARRNFAS
jgi:hypothetical protein